MNSKKYNYAIYAIVFVIAVVIGIQVYWNIINYQNNRVQLINDVQVGVDNAVNTYFKNEAEKNTLALETTADFNIFEDSTLDSITRKIDEYGGIDQNDSLGKYASENLKIFQGKKGDSVKRASEIKTAGSGVNINKKRIDKDGRETGSSNYKFSDVTLDDLKQLKKTRRDSANEKDKLDVQFLTSQIVITITSDSIPLKELDTLVRKELLRKNIESNFGLKFIKKDSTNSYLNKPIVENAELQTQSESSFIPKGTSLYIYFDNPNREVFFRSFTGILISLALILGVVSILFYLLKIINNQKQLAEIKNDLINNITHEFKTPIATVAAAIEGMKNFDALDNKEKTRNYLDISEVQLTKLNIMVEKLLETASLEKDNLELSLEKFDLNKLIRSIVDNYKIQLNNKTLEYHSNLEFAEIQGDPFHLENAINNLIDNAIKYGGNRIDIRLVQHSSYIEIFVSDSGKSLTSKNSEKIFDKFYRVPKGDIHDIKGFGIGLYYTRKIIQKHGGKINVNLENNGTNFIIILPHGAKG